LKKLVIDIDEASCPKRDEDLHVLIRKVPISCRGHHYAAPYKRGETMFAF
jgi:hypothetical protein